MCNQHGHGTPTQDGAPAGLYSCADNSPAAANTGAASDTFVRDHPGKARSDSLPSKPAGAAKASRRTPQAGQDLPAPRSPRTARKARQLGASAACLTTTIVGARRSHEAFGYWDTLSARSSAGCAEGPAQVRPESVVALRSRPPPELGCLPPARAARRPVASLASAGGVGVSAALSLESVGMSAERARSAGPTGSWSDRPRWPGALVGRGSTFCAGTESSRAEQMHYAHDRGCRRHRRVMLPDAQGGVAELHEAGGDQQNGAVT